MSITSRARRSLSALALAAVAAVCAGCGPVEPLLAPDGVRLLLVDPEPGTVGCPANVIEGDLVPASAAGVAIEAAGEHLPIRWPTGYSGRRDGGTVLILDAAGEVVARTGTHINLNGGTVERGVWLACPIPP